MSIRRVTMHQSALRLEAAAERQGVTVDAPSAPAVAPARTRKPAKKSKRATR